MLAGIIIVFILSGVLVYIILLNTSDSVKYRKDNSESSENKITKNTHHEDKKDKDNKEYMGNYITPARFSIGLLKEVKYVSSNNCDHNVLYPINGLGPDYGWKIPKNCRCTEFVQSP